MGADFLLYRIPAWPDFDRERHTPLIRERLERMTDEDLATLVEEDLHELVNPGLDEVADEIVGRIEAIQNGDHFREVVELDGWIYTGGMSWGDPPTDAAEVMGPLANFPELARPPAIHERTS